VAYISNGTISIFKGTAPTGVAANLTTGGSIPNGTYNYKVAAVFSGVGESLPSSAANVTVANSTNDAVILTWTAVTGASSYKIYRKLSTDSNYVKYITSTTNSVVDTNQIQSDGSPQTSDEVSNIVLGSGTSFSTSGVIAGNSFKVSLDPVIYQVASVVSDTKLTLSVNYTASAVINSGYQVCNYYTPNLGLAEIDKGTADWPYWLTAEVIRKLDQKFGSGTASGLDVDKVDGFNASKTAVANEIPVKDSSGDLALPTGSVLVSTATNINNDKLQVKGSAFIRNSDTSGTGVLITGGATTPIIDGYTYNQGVGAPLALQVTTGKNVLIGTSTDANTGKLQVAGDIALTSVTTYSSATQGAASALPATPAGYLKITIDGNVRKIPYYE